MTSLNSQQKTTIKGLLIAGLVSVVLVAFLLVVEGHALVVGGHSTISELIWLVWAKQPWVIWLVSVLLAFLIGFFSGHFTAQSNEEYEKIRKDGL